MKQSPSLYALFQKRFEGDDALLSFTRKRFEDEGLGAEMYAASAEELEPLLTFAPRTGLRPMVHLPRDVDITSEACRARIAQMAARFSGRVEAFVIHDQEEASRNTDGYVDAAFILNSLLARIKAEHIPTIYIEYAVGLRPELYGELFQRLKDTDHLNACIDIGHLGLYYIRERFAQHHPEINICSLSPQHERLPELLDDVEEAVQSALPEVLYIIEALAKLGKTLHFHLHDAHPLYDKSAFGISDHLSFFETINVPLRKSPLLPLYGPDGLAQILRAASHAPALSLSLEIHPCGERLPLAPAAEAFFSHWGDTANAERTNHWLMCLIRNLCLLRHLLDTQTQRSIMK